MLHVVDSKHMKRQYGLFIALLIVGCVCISGCTGTAPQATTTPATPAPTTPGTTVSTATTIPARLVFDDVISLKSGYKDTYQKYAFEDYGFQYLYPGDSFKVSVTADKPVNVLVIDKDDEIKFPSATPEWNTVLKKDQWDYSPLVPAFVQSNVQKKDMVFTIKDKSMYFLVIDPRFSSSQEGWRDTVHEEVKVTVKVIKI